MRQLKLFVFGLVLTLVLFAVPLAAAQPGPAGQLARAPKQTAPTLSVPTVAATPPAYPGGVITTDTGTDTQGTLIAGIIIWVVIVIVVAVTVFLVWWTRPARRQARGEMGPRNSQ